MPVPWSEIAERSSVNALLVALHVVLPESDSMALACSVLELQLAGCCYLRVRLQDILWQLSFGS